MNVPILIAGIITAVSFGAAAWIAFSRRPVARTKHSWMPMLGLSAAMGLYAFVGLSNVLEYSGVTSALDLIEDYAELLFVPLLILASYATEAQMRLDERAHAGNLLQQQNDLLLNIVDTTPVGIMIVAPGGHITFANDPARNMLSIAMDHDTGMLAHPDWHLSSPEGGEVPLDSLVSGQAVSGARRILTWPDGRRQQFMFSVTPMNDATKTLGGAVVAFEAVTTGG
jgi:PAS domain-containing protein